MHEISTTTESAGSISSSIVRQPKTCFAVIPSGSLAQPAIIIVSGLMLYFVSFVV